MNPTVKAALQESLKQEDAAVKARLDETAPTAASGKTAPAKAAKPKVAKPAAPAKAAPAPAKSEPKAVAKKPAAKPRAAKAAPEVKPAAAPEAVKALKVSRESFSLPEAEAAGLKSLRTTLAKEGRIVTKSELVRAGIQLLAGLKAADLIAAVNALLPVVKKKKKK